MWGDKREIERRRERSRETETQKEKQRQRWRQRDRKRETGTDKQRWTQRKKQTRRWRQRHRDTERHHEGPGPHPQTCQIFTTIPAAMPSMCPRADTFIMPIGWGLGTYTLAFPSGLTLHQYFAQGAGIAGSAGCEAHVLARVSTSQVVQDKRTRAIGVFNEDVVRVHLHWLPIWKGNTERTPSGTKGQTCLGVTVTGSDGGSYPYSQEPMDSLPRV